MADKKSTFRILAEALAFEKLDKVNVSCESLNVRRLTIDEIKELIGESFEKAKDVEDVKTQEPDKGWADAELENEINWAETLDLKEYFNFDKKDDSEDSEDSDESDSEKEDEDSED